MCYTDAAAVHRAAQNNWPQGWHRKGPGGQLQNPPASDGAAGFFVSCYHDTMETFNEFVRKAQEDAIQIVGPRNMTNHAMIMAMMERLHARVVAMEFADAHARGDERRREDPAP